MTITETIEHQRLVEDRKKKKPIGDGGDLISLKDNGVQFAKIIPLTVTPGIIFHMTMPAHVRTDGVKMG